MHELYVFLILNQFIVFLVNAAVDHDSLSAFDIGNGRGTFARVEGRHHPQLWRAAACPVEMTSTSCYWHNYSRAWDLEHRPLPEASRPFSVSEFEELIRCRTVLFLGDSVALQFWQAVTCLMPLTNARIDVQWLQPFNDKICPFGPHHCFIAGGCVSFPNISSRLCYVNDIHFWNASQLLLSLGLTEDSIVVANTGLHFIGPKPLLHTVAAFLRAFHNPNTTQKSCPTIVWFESIAQHFPEASGYYDIRHYKKYRHCSPVDAEKAARLDWRNLVLEDLLRGAGIPILRLWNLTVRMWDAHVVFSGRTDLGYKADCTHFCVPSITQQW
eukprot:EG_transcript_18909